MKAIIIYLLFSCNMLFIPVSITAQEIEKEKVYFLFKENDGNNHPALGKKFINDEEINFNLYIHYFVHKQKHSLDTLSINKLIDYPLTEENNIKNLKKKWWKKNLNKLKNKYREIGIIPPIDRNGIFNPYIIEKIGSDKIVVYQVEFRNEGVVP